MTLLTPLHISYSFRLAPGAANLKFPSLGSESSWEFQIPKPRQVPPLPKFVMTWQHPLRRTSEAKGTSKYLIPVSLIDLKLPNELAAGDAGLQIGGTSIVRNSSPPFDSNVRRRVCREYDANL
jgi:hypothetical protein